MKIWHFFSANYDHCCLSVRIGRLEANPSGLFVCLQTHVYIFTRDYYMLIDVISAESAFESGKIKKDIRNEQAPGFLVQLNRSSPYFI